MCSHIEIPHIFSKACFEWFQSIHLIRKLNSRMLTFLHGTYWRITLDKRVLILLTLGWFPTRRGGGPSQTNRPCPHLRTSLLRFAPSCREGLCAREAKLRLAERLRKLWPTEGSYGGSTTSLGADLVKDSKSRTFQPTFSSTQILR